MRGGSARARAGAGPWVLVTDDRMGQARSALATVRALAAAGYNPAVTVATPYSLAAASRHCARRVAVPSALVGTPGFREAVEAELAANPYLAVLPTGDAALLALGAPVEHLVNKASLEARVAAAGLQSPPSESFANLDELRRGASRLRFPLVVKPVVSQEWLRRTISPKRVETASDLDRLADDGGPVIAQPFLTEAMTSFSGVVWKGRLVAAVHHRCLRTWPPDCGGASAAETTEPDLGLEERVLGMLDGFEGIFQVQLSGRYVLDVNPRVYGTLSLAVRAGANLAGIYCDLLRGVETEPVVRARPGVPYRWVEGETRYALRAMQRRDLDARGAFALLRPIRGAAHGPESLRDPGPLVARARHMLAARRGATSASTTPLTPATRRSA